jgi:ABC-type nickel/cobalt efflux system permease component RcnA
MSPEFLLIGAVAVVGVLHTIVPDHWVPITLIARQRGWTRAETAKASLQAGIGHVVSTLVIASVVWIGGVAVATRFGQAVDTVASIVLIAFGGWIAISALREMRVGGHGHGHSHGHSHAPHSYATEFDEHEHGAHGHDHGDHDHGDEPSLADDKLYMPLGGETAELVRHVHVHRHGSGMPHQHWHDHAPATAHAVPADAEANPPAHAHQHKTTVRTALLLILGSSPMVEGIPAFFAAGQYGIGLIIAMAIVFAISTIATYVLLCVYSTAGLQRVRLGAIERYGEVLSGAFIALVGVAFWIWPVM